MSIPSELLRAVCDPSGGKIVLVTGAGVSVEPPTEIPVASRCSEEAHRQLVLDGIIEEGACPDPKDLSVLADVVMRTTNSQRELAIRLPHEAMRNASPNEGHLIAIALMVEGAVSNIVTLNYDLAFSHAISELQVKNGIADIRGPENHAQLGQKNLIYLHRSADSDMETWVLTTYSLEEQWKDKWEELMIRFATASPVIIFAGLGSSCGVLRYSSKKLRDAIGERSRAFLVTRSNPAGSRFAFEIQIQSQDCIQCGWVDFMRTLAQRFLENVAIRINSTATQLSTLGGWLDSTGSPREDIAQVLQRAKAMGLLAFSVIRARWQLRNDAYRPIDQREVDSLADVFVAIRLIETVANAHAQFLDCGRVRFTTVAGKAVDITIVCGNGTLRWGSVEPEIKKHERYLRRPRPSSPAGRILALQIIGTRTTAIAPPPTIIDARPNGDLVIGGESIQLWGADQIRENPLLVGDLLR